MSAALLIAPLSAQKVALGGDYGDQIVQLLDCSRLGNGVAMASFARFVAVGSEPSLPVANVAALGTSHLAVLGTLQQCAAAEKVFAVAVAQVGEEFGIGCKVLRMSAVAHAQLVQPLFAPAGKTATPESTATLTVAKYDDLLAALRGMPGCNVVTTPTIVVRQLTLATLRVGLGRHYVADAVLCPDGGGDGKLAVLNDVRELFDGSSIDAVVVRRDARSLLLHLRTEHTAYPASLPQVEVALANGDKATIDVPHGLRCASEVCVTVPDGQVLLTAAPLADGTFVVWAIKASSYGKPR